MEEKVVKIKKDKSIWIILLVGILIIALGCCITYIWRMNNNEIQLTEETSNSTEMQLSKNENNNTDNKTNITIEKNEEDKDSLDVYGMNEKFKELSKAAIKVEKLTEKKSDIIVERKIEINYDLNDDGIKEKITNKNEKIYINNKKFYECQEPTRSPRYIYVIDLDKSDNSVEVVVESLGEGDYTSFDIYRLSNNTMKEVTLDSYYVTDVSELYTDSEGKILALNDIDKNMTPLFTLGYYLYDNGKLLWKEISLKDISEVDFIIKGYKYDDKFEYFMVKNEEEIKKVHDNSRKYAIEEDIKIKLLPDEYDSNSYVTSYKVKLENGEIRYIYMVRGTLTE